MTEQSHAVKEAAAGTGQSAAPGRLRRRRRSTWLSDLLHVIQTIAIAVGVLFGMVQLSEMRDARKLEARLTLVDLLQNPARTQAIRTMYELQNGLSYAQLMALDSTAWQSLLTLMDTWESVGLMVYRKDVELDVVQDFFGSPILDTYTKLEAYIRECQRADPLCKEWFRWLRDRLDAHKSSAGDQPAYVRHQNWRS